jgi:hypothetical protein
MQQRDALFNWLQIQIVWDARPNDASAKDTVQFFQTMLEEDHQITDLKLEKCDDQYEIHYKQGSEEQKVTFPTEIAEKLLRDITEEPKYNDCV